ncbi:MAG: TetR/AcrR family transcriptional regulator [Deltaproteobacteria bacterium]|nr:TetR/AcrR family transcriptional regulator [Deltaproteobacteria bacterium]
MTRSYVMGKRAAEVEDRRSRMLSAAFTLFGSLPYEKVTLKAVAAEAEVGLKTVVRAFGTKEDLVRACMEAGPRAEESARLVRPGDVEGVVSVLAARYELMFDRTPYVDGLAERVPLVGEWIQRSRESHRRWLGGAFAPWLPESGFVRERRLMALFVATEIRDWYTLRRHFGLSAEVAREVMAETLLALVRAWGESAGRTTNR